MASSSLSEGIMSGAVEGVALLIEQAQSHVAYLRSFDSQPMPRSVALIEGLIASLTTPPVRSYADGVEDAAKVADDYALGALEGGEPLIEATAETIAAAIRLLSRGGRA